MHTNMCKLFLSKNPILCLSFIRTRAFLYLHVPSKSPYSGVYVERLLIHFNVRLHQRKRNHLTLPCSIFTLYFFLWRQSGKRKSRTRRRSSSSNNRSKKKGRTRKKHRQRTRNNSFFVHSFSNRVNQIRQDFETSFLSHVLSLRELKREPK